MKKKSKLRKVYVRRKITHICHNGYLYAPKEGNTTSAVLGEYIRVANNCGKNSIVIATLNSKPRIEVWTPTLIGQAAIKIDKQEKCYRVVLPVDKNGHPLGMPTIKRIEDAIILSMNAKTTFNIKQEEWDRQKWGYVYCRQTLAIVAKVNHDGTIMMNNEIKSLHRKSS